MISIPGGKPVNVPLCPPMIDILVSNLGLCGEKPVTCTRNKKKITSKYLLNPAEVGTESE